jgi:hypothetical protein
MDEKQRTIQQNRALHKYFEQVAEKLNSMGLDMRVVLKPSVDIPWSKDTVKEFLWKPIQRLQLSKSRTRDLAKDGDIDKHTIPLIDFLVRSFLYTFLSPQWKPYG